jgi:hypothetical protein
MTEPQRSCLPLIACHFLVSTGRGRGPASGNLESDCPWYAVDADGCRKGIFLPIRWVKSYHGHKRGQGWWNQENDYP